MKINALLDIDNCEHLILVTLFQTQLVEPKGITWGELWEREPIKKKMSRQTYSHRIKDLLELGILEKEVIRNKKGKPTFYRLNSELFAELCEFRDKNYPWNVKNAIEDFEKEIQNYDTKRYVEMMLEIAFGQLSLLAIMLTNFELEGARSIFYEANYENIEQVLGYVLKRVNRSRVDKEQTLLKLFEILEPYAERRIGKQFGLDEVYDSKKALINKIIGPTD